MAETENSPLQRGHHSQPRFSWATLKERKSMNTIYKGKFNIENLACVYSTTATPTLKHLPNSLRVSVPIQDNMLKRESFKNSKILKPVTVLSTQPAIWFILSQNYSLLCFIIHSFYFTIQISTTHKKKFGWILIRNLFGLLSKYDGIKRSYFCGIPV